MSVRLGRIKSESNVCAYCPMQPLLIRSKGERTSASLRRHMEIKRRSLDARMAQQGLDYW